MKEINNINDAARETLASICWHYPQILPLLKGRARWIALTIGAKSRIVEEKTYDYFLSELSRMVRNLYAGNIGGEFIDILANLLDGQINQAYRQAWSDEGADGEFPEYLQAAADDAILAQFDFVDGFFRDIVDARIDETPIDPLLARCSLWANRWNEAYNDGVRLIAINAGEKQIWKLGATEEHCPFCSRYNGIVALASEWDALNIRPQSAPNPALTGTLNGEPGCGGWRCDCSLETTDKRRSPNAYGRLEEILNSR